MKKIIKNKVYDTETAKECGTYANTYDTRNFGFCQETLYKKKTGEYFIYGKGNVFSKYAHVHGNDRGWGDQIIPVDYEGAKDWAEEHLDAEEYTSIFGEVEEDESKSTLNIYIRKDVIAKLKQQSEQEGISISEIIESKLR